jgi:hypothetical protein
MKSISGKYLVIIGLLCIAFIMGAFSILSEPLGIIFIMIGLALGLSVIYVISKSKLRKNTIVFIGIMVLYFIQNYYILRIAYHNNFNLFSITYLLEILELLIGIIIITLNFKSSYKNIIREKEQLSRKMFTAKLYHLIQVSMAILYIIIIVILSLTESETDHILYTFMVIYIVVYFVIAVLSLVRSSYFAEPLKYLIIGLQCLIITFEVVNFSLSLYDYKSIFLDYTMLAIFATLVLSLLYKDNGKMDPSKVMTKLVVIFGYIGLALANLFTIFLIYAYWGLS